MTRSDDEQPLRDLREELERRLEAAVYDLLESCKASNWSLLRRRLPDAVLGGGKRLRPLMFLTVIRAGGRVLDLPAWDAAVGMELLHSFALLHDDVIDGSQRRRGRPSFHCAAAAELRQVAQSETAGMGLAVLAGDILYAGAMARFQHLKVPDSMRDRVLRILTETALRTAGGVFREVESRAMRLGELDAPTLERISAEKTAEYTFVCPLRLGAILARLASGPEATLARAGRRMGVAYQLRDDLDDLDAFLGGREEAAGMSLSETLTMLPVFLTYRAANTREKTWLEELYLKGRADEDARLQLRTILDEYGTRARVERRIGELFTRAVHALRLAKLSSEGTASLADVWRGLLRLPDPQEIPSREGTACHG